MIKFIKSRYIGICIISIITIISIIIITMNYSLRNSFKELSDSVDDVIMIFFSDYIDIAIIDEGTNHDLNANVYVYVDKNTRVMYYVQTSIDKNGSSVSFPILNADGTPKLYEGDFD